MKTVFKSATKFILLSALVFLVSNCDNDDTNPLGDNQQVSSTEINTILNTDSISSAADDIITSVFTNSQSSKSAKLEDCHVTEFSDTGFTITFDNCTYEGGEAITGTITIVLSEGQENSYTATYTDLMVGEYEINGTRSFVVSGNELSDISLTITSDMTITLEDGAIVEESGVKVLGFILDFNNLENSGATIDGNWTLLSDGNTYLVDITTTLEITGNCDYVGTGVMELSKNGLEVNVDFGDGTCDDIALLIYPDGSTEEISLKD